MPSTMFSTLQPAALAGFQGERCVVGADCRCRDSTVVKWWRSRRSSARFSRSS